MYWLQANAANQQINPLISTELTAALPVILEVEGSELDWFHIFNPERAAFSPGILIVLVGDVHLRPDATHQYPVIFADVALWNMDIFMAEIDDFSPVLVFVREIAYFHFINEGMSPLLTY